MNKSHQDDDDNVDSDVTSAYPATRTPSDFGILRPVPHQTHSSNNKTYQKSPEKISEVIDSLQNKINELNTVIDHLKTTVSTMQYDIHNLQSVQMQYLITNLKMETNLNYLLGQSDYLKHSTHPLYIQQSQEQYQTNQYTQVPQQVQYPGYQMNQQVQYPGYQTPVLVNQQCVKK